MIEMFSNPPMAKEQIKDRIRESYYGKDWKRLWFTMTEVGYAWKNIWREYLRKLGMPERVKSEQELADWLALIISLIPVVLILALIFLK